MIMRGIEWSWFGQDQRLVLVLSACGGGRDELLWREKRITPDTGISGWLTDRETKTKTISGQRPSIENKEGEESQYGGRESNANT